MRARVELGRVGMGLVNSVGLGLGILTGKNQSRLCWVGLGKALGTTQAESKEQVVNYNG